MFYDSSRKYISLKSKLLIKDKCYILSIWCLEVDTIFRHQPVSSDDFNRARLYRCSLGNQLSGFFLNSFTKIKTRCSEQDTFANVIKCARTQTHAPTPH